MFNLLIDFFRVLFLSFSRDGKTRLLAGAGFACILMTIVFSGFTAWLSQPRYADILGGISMEMAWCMSGVIALGMLLMVALIANDIMQSRILDQELPPYFAYLCIFCILLGAFDVMKNFEGSTDRSNEIAAKQDYKYESGPLPYQDKIAELEEKKAKIYEPYYWKGKLYFEPAPVTRHPKSKFKRDEAKVIALDEQIATWQQKQTNAVSKADDLTNAQNTLAEDKGVSAEKGLQIMSVSIYLLMLILSLVWTAISNQLEKDQGDFGLEHLGKNKGAGVVGFNQMATAKKPSQSKPPTFNIMVPRIRFKWRDTNGAKSSGFRHGNDTHTTIEKHTVDLGNSAPKFSRINQPTRYAGIRERDYKKFVKAARKILSEDGKYIKTKISREAWNTEDRRKVDRYLKVAFERKDLPNS